MFAEAVKMTKWAVGCYGYADGAKDNWGASRVNFSMEVRIFLVLRDI